MPSLLLCRTIRDRSMGEWGSGQRSQPLEEWLRYDLNFCEKRRQGQAKAVHPAGVVAGRDRGGPEAPCTTV
jgi:hypothetical protein